MKLHVPAAAPSLDANGEETGAVEAFSVHTDSSGGRTLRWLVILGYVVDSDGGQTQRICARIPLAEGLAIVQNAPDETPEPARDRCGEETHEPHEWAGGRYYCDGRIHD